MEKEMKMKIKEIEKRNEEPFYERLRREDKERQNKKIKSVRDVRARMTHSAAFKNGKCLLDLNNINDYSLIDEKKARIHQEKENIKQD